jgi:hypothetical protein
MAAVVKYEPPTGDEEMGFVYRRRLGKVRPHPEFQLQLDSQGQVTSRRADLAVVLLNKPVAQVEPVGLADNEITVGEMLVLAGFMPEWPGSLNSMREFITTRAVAEARPGEGEFQVEHSALSLDDNNRGGPCLRETERGLFVAGLSTGDRDGSPSCASILAYRPWLVGEIQNAASVGSVRPGVPSPRHR